MDNIIDVNMTNEKLNKVYIANRGGHNYTPAARFGILVPLTTGNINPLQVDRLTYDILEATNESTEHDFLLISGHQIINALAACLLLRKHHILNMLIFNKHTNDYMVRTLTEEQIAGIVVKDNEVGE